MNRRQEWFNTMVRGLASQEWAASLAQNGYSCAYLGSGGKKCAIGWLLPDGHSAQNSIYGMRKLYADGLLGDVIGVVSMSDIQFLDECQTAHDDSQSDRQSALEMRNRFAKLASKFELQWPEGV